MGDLVNRCVETVERLKRARDEADEAMTAFFFLMLEVEQDESLWRGDKKAGTGYATFSELLKEAKIVEAHRFDRFKRFVSMYGEQEARNVGALIAIEHVYVNPSAPSLRRIDTTASKAILDETTETRRRTGMPVSREHYHTIQRKHYLPERAVKPKRTMTYDEMERALAKALRDVAERDARIKTLEGALAKANRKITTNTYGPLNMPVAARTKATKEKAKAKHGRA